MSLGIEEQREILIKEFLQIEVALDQKLTKDELYLKLDQKLGKKFERSIADQLVAKLDTDEDGKFVAEQFFGIIIDAEQALLQKIDQTRMFLSEYKAKRKNVIQKYEEELQAEKKNEFNIMVGSLLYIKPLNTSFGQEYTYVKVQCGLSQESIAWNQVSQFPIQTSTEDVTVAIFKIEGDEPQAITHIQLNALRDQKKIEKTIDMSSFDGRQLKIGKIKLELHWIHSKTELLENVILSWDNQIKQLEEDLYGYQNDLTTLLEPFPGLFQVIKQVDTYQENQQFESTSGINYNSKGQKMRASFLDDPNLFIPSSQQSIQVGEVFKVLAYSNLAYIIIALILSYSRVVYLDMLICMSYFIEVYTKSEYNLTNFKIYSIITLVSTTFEIIWLVFFTISWWEERIPNFKLQRTIVIFSFLFALIKIELVALYLYLYSDFSKNPEQKFAQENMMFDNNSPKGSFLVGENMNLYSNKIVKQPQYRESIQVTPQLANINFLSAPQIPQQPNLQSSRINSNAPSNNNIYSTADLNFNDQMNLNINNNLNVNNTNRYSQQMNFSNRPSAHPQFVSENNFRDSSFKNFQINSPQQGVNFNSSQNINQQQYYVSSFNQNNYLN